MLVIDRENDRVLLGTRPKFVSQLWSCLSGFIEVCVLTNFKTFLFFKDSRISLLYTCFSFFCLSPFSMYIKKLLVCILLFEFSQEKAWRKL
jgi:hypothetical protein